MAAGAAGFAEDRAMKRGESDVEKSAAAMTLGMGRGFGDKVPGLGELEVNGDGTRALGE